MTTVLALAFALSAPPEDVFLAWKLKEGDTFYSQGKATIEQTFTVQGRDVEQTMTSDTVVRYKVKSVKPGTTVLEMTYLSNKTEAQGIPGANAANGKLKGVTLTATLDGKLEVVKLEGYDKLLDALAGNNDAARAAAKAVLPEAAVKQLLNGTFALVPGSVAKPGKTWKRKDTVPLGPLGDVATASTFKLASLKDDTATVTWSGEGTFKGSDGAIPGLPVKFTKIDLKTDKLGGSYTFDLTAGRVKEARTNMELSGSLTVTANGQDVTMDLKQKLKQTATISEKNPVKD